MGRRSRGSLVPLVAVLGLVAIALGVDAVAPGGIEWGTALRNPEGETPARVALPEPDNRIRVEVLNAGGIPGMAGRARDRLRDEGFDVVYYGNAASFDQARSVVLARVTREGAAEGVAAALGISAVAVETDSTRLVDVSVLLGSDWTPEEEG